MKLKLKKPAALGIESTATITIAEKRDGSLQLSIEFDPPVHGETGESHAARLATSVFRMLAQTIGGQSV
jgi:hypothetical protein